MLDIRMRDDSFMVYLVAHPATLKSNNKRMNEQ
jgi:hypothetical protein